VIEQLKQFLDIDDDVQKLGRDLWDVLEPSIDMVLDTFYDKMRTAGMGPHLSDAAVARLKAKQRDHWESLFRSRFDEHYTTGARRVGIRHRDVNLDIPSYVAGYAALKIEFVNIIVQANLPVLTKGLLIKTLDKYVAFDMAQALTIYEAAIVD